MNTALRNGVLLSSVIYLTFLVAIGCKRDGAPSTDTEATRPMDSYHATGPLALSDPALNPREWLIKALFKGYQNTGRTNVAWDSIVEPAFEAYADYTRVSRTNWPSLEKALAALATSPCDDPMIQYMRVRYREVVQSNATMASQLGEAHDAMLLSKYHPLFKFVAGVRAVEAARSADRNSSRTDRIQQVTSALELLARDTNAPVDEVFDAASMWLNHHDSKAWIEYVTHNLNGILQQNWGATERWLRFQGEAEIMRAWVERGGGWATAVTVQGWDGFREHLAKAEDLLTRAWNINPTNAQTAYLMMRVELGQGKGRERMETWFARAMSFETNHYDAVELMSFYLEPRWHGSVEESLKFARACVQSEKWGGQVPLVLAKVHHSLATYLNLTNSPAYWQRPEVWPDIQSSYEKFFTLSPNAAGWRHDYASDAYYCGQYSVFLEQTKLFAYGTNYDFFGGKDEFEKMLATARKADGNR